MESSVKALVNYRYVKTGKFSKEASKIIKYASESREKADYLDFYVASKSEAEKQIERAENFVALVKEYLLNNGIMYDDLL